MGELPRARDPFKEEMRNLISMNENYFQNKLKVCDNGSPNNLKLKIPSKTGSTVYKHDYVKNYSSSAGLNKKSGKYTNISTEKNNFFGGTTYEADFIKHK